MHLITCHSAPSDLQPIVTAADACAANDSGIRAQARCHRSDANLLVARVVGRVAAQTQPEKVNIELILAPGHPVIDTDPTALAFAISGVLSAQLSALDEGDGGDIRVAVVSDVHEVQILMTTDELPPLRFIRALDQATAGEADPTLRHCCRIIESEGGTLELIEQDGKIGFSISLPRETLSPTLRILPVATSAPASAPEVLIAA